MSNLIWSTLITIAVLTFFYSWQAKEPGTRLIGYLFSFIFWIATIFQWIIDNSGTANIMIVLAQIAPALLCLVWGLQTLAEVTDRPLKRDPFA